MTELKKFNELLDDTHSHSTGSSTFREKTKMLVEALAEINSLKPIHLIKSNKLAEIMSNSIEYSHIGKRRTLQVYIGQLKRTMIEAGLVKDNAFDFSDQEAIVERRMIDYNDKNLHS